MERNPEKKSTEAEVTPDDMPVVEVKGLKEVILVKSTGVEVPVSIPRPAVVVELKELGSDGVMRP